MEHTTRVLWYLARRAAGVRWSSASFKNANARGNKLAQEVRGAVVQLGNATGAMLRRSHCTFPAPLCCASAVEASPAGARELQVQPQADVNGACLLSSRVLARVHSLLGLRDSSRCSMLRMQGRDPRPDNVEAMLAQVGAWPVSGGCTHAVTVSTAVQCA
jgi:hypothetical protein